MQRNVQAFSADVQGEGEPNRVSLSVTRTSRGTPASFIHPNTKGDDEQNWDYNSHEAHGLTGHQGPGSYVSIPKDDTSKGRSTKTIMGSVVPVLGVSSFSLLLYKVTAVGGFINRFLGRNRNMYNHIEYVNAFNPYSEGMDPVDRRMNISYHRL
ncbi:hypothetical protein PVBG_06210 [Plasmodium vivax Brazil I]|uniref:Uncharacterized protein n=1 Tax=Plasmodium vivax (strain Brazil I) TaxID=1033975 RepID=A0A0J9SK21_PLAV1|nr:hypothetical protein PVBG_06210 [Plasmodium vivax Brazil I]